MAKFITGQIEKAAVESLEAGQEKYRAYFIKTKLYANSKKAVDAQLKEDGYKDVIVTK